MGGADPGQWAVPRLRRHIRHAAVPGISMASKTSTGLSSCARPVLSWRSERRLLASCASHSRST